MYPERTTSIDARGRRAESFSFSDAREPVLQDFSLGRPEGQHDTHIARLAISRRELYSSGQRIYFIALADDDAREDIGGRLRCIDLASLGDELSSATISLGEIEDTASIGFRSTPPPGIPLLAGFYFSKIGGGDHHLREVAVLPIRGGYSVTFRDDSPHDDRYFASIDVVWVPEAKVDGIHDRSFDDAVGAIDVPREPGQAALRGFSLRYRENDHHVSRISVGLSSDRIRMVMRDNNRNRRFQGSVDYAILRS